MVDVTLGVFVLLMGAAFVCEYIDASLGMGYGTILTPALLVAGFDTLTVVPAVLISQAAGGLVAALFHQRLKNVAFSRGSRDSKILLVLISFGLLASVVAALAAIRLPPIIRDTYIGLLVFVMGVLVLRNRTFSFSWRRMVGVGILSAFNKGISGGGFGPVVTAGQVLAGQGHRAAVGVTTMAEVPICLAGFVTYMVGRFLQGPDAGGISISARTFAEGLVGAGFFSWDLAWALILGSVLVAPFAAATTRTLRLDHLRTAVGVLILVLGVATLFRTWF